MNRLLRILFGATCIGFIALTGASCSNGVSSRGSSQVQTPNWLISVDEHNVAMKGYDPVSYFSPGGPKLGKSSHRSTVNFATYHFSNSANKSAFDANPDRYIPKFGGFCGTAASLGKVEDSDPHSYQMFDNKLVMQKNAKASAVWQKNPSKHYAKASKNWPGLVRTHGKVKSITYSK